MADLLGEEYETFRTSLDEKPQTGLRVNTLKIPVEEFRSISPFRLSPVPWSESGFVLGENPEGWSVSPGRHPYHRAGLYYLQEPSAMAAAEVLSPLPGEKVLDLAGAPGGKTTHLAGLMKNAGLLVANEIHPSRVWDLAENLERCGVTHSIVVNETPARLADLFGEYFDRVLLDAPCSGEGMFRKGEPARREWKPNLPQSCSIRQREILEQAARLVKVGGKLAYTTCTFSPEENEGVISSFLIAHPEFDICSIDRLRGLQNARPEWVILPSDHPVGKAARIWPHRSLGEGHFIALLKKTGSLAINYPHRYPPRKIPKFPPGEEKKPSAFRSLFELFARTNLNSSWEMDRVKLHGSYLYHEPEDLPDLTGLKIIHPGWWLGTVQNDRFIPSHALAMGLRQEQAVQNVSLQPDDPKLAAYLTGESLNSPGDNGWLLVTVDGYPLGWGKRVQNVIKNFYPHGLRKPA